MVRQCFSFMYMFLIVQVAFAGDGKLLVNSNASLPSAVLDLTNWKLNIPIAGDNGYSKEISQPELDAYSDDYFHVNTAGDAVVFRAHANGVTTSGSTYPRSELREMTDGGTKKASWNIGSGNGTHIMEITQAVTHLPTKKPHVVVGQIHDAGDDVIVFRLENKKLFIDHNGKGGPVLTSNYELGTKFTVKFVAGGGGVMCFYNGEYIETYPSTATGCYFKAGMYTQSKTTENGGKESASDAEAYGEVEIYSVTVEHDYEHDPIDENASEATDIVYDYLDARFNDGEWNVLSDSQDFGNFPSSVQNDYTLSNAYVHEDSEVNVSGFGKLTNRVIIDKNTNDGYIITPYVFTCEELKVVATHDSGDKDFKVFYQYDGDSGWVELATTNTTSKKPTLYTYPFTSTNDNPVRFKIANNGGSKFSIYHISTLATSNPTVTIGATGYATYCAPNAYQLPEGVEAYICTSLSDSKVLLQKNDSRIIPAKTGVILKGEAGTYNLTPTSSSVSVARNLLKPNLVAANCPTTIGNKRNFILAEDHSKAVFALSNGGVLPGRKAYLQIEEAEMGLAKQIGLVPIDGETFTAIQKVGKTYNTNSAIYNLCGQRMENKTRGLYVINGKKTVIR